MEKRTKKELERNLAFAEQEVKEWRAFIIKVKREIKNYELAPIKPHRRSRKGH
jgi:hypothetical protein